MKKLLAVLILVVMVVSLFGCASNQTGNVDEGETANNGGEKTIGDEQDKNSSGEVKIPSPTTKDGPLKLAYVPSVMNVYYDQVLSGMKEEVDKLGGSDIIEILIHAPTSNQTTVNEQINIMENLIQQGVDVIAISAESDEPLSALFKKAAEAGIVVFEFNMPTVDLTSEYYVSNIGYDQFEAGRLIGEWAVEYFGDKKTKTAVLEGFPGTLNTQRLEGFLKGIEGNDNFDVAFSQTANWTRDDGQSVTENMLEAHPDIDFIVGLYDEMSLGAYNAVKEAGLEEQIVIAGYDNTEAGYESIKNGQMAMTVDNGAKNIGRSIVISAYQYCMQGKEIERVIDVGSVVYDQGNIEEFDTDNYRYIKQEPIENYLQD